MNFRITHEIYRSKMLDPLITPVTTRVSVKMDTATATATQTQTQTQSLSTRYQKAIIVYQMTHCRISSANDVYDI